MRVLWKGVGFAFAAVGVGTSAAVLSTRETGVEQPVAFDHAKHMETSNCRDCHRHFETRPIAGMPRNADCLACHEKRMSSDAEEERVRKEYWEPQVEIPWIRFHFVPDHVRFSHKRHVMIGGLKCEECHGEVAAEHAPLSTAPGGTFSMDRCMECHEEKGASLDCFTCHR